jgi:hypothetical protein
MIPIYKAREALTKPCRRTEMWLYLPKEVTCRRRCARPTPMPNGQARPCRGRPALRPRNGHPPSPSSCGRSRCCSPSPASRIRSPGELLRCRGFFMPRIAGGLGGTRHWTRCREGAWQNKEGRDRLRHVPAQRPLAMAVCPAPIRPGELVPRYCHDPRAGNRATSTGTLIAPGSSPA